MIYLRRSSQSFSYDLNSMLSSAFFEMSSLFSLSIHWAICVIVSKFSLSSFSRCMKSALFSPVLAYSSSIFLEIFFTLVSRILQISHRWFSRAFAVDVWISLTDFMMFLYESNISCWSTFLICIIALGGTPAPTTSTPTSSPSNEKGFVDFIFISSVISSIVLRYSYSRLMYRSCLTIRFDLISSWIFLCSLYDSHYWW